MLTAIKSAAASVAKAAEKPKPKAPASPATARTEAAAQPPASRQTEAPKTGPLTTTGAPQDRVTVDAPEKGKSSFDTSALAANWAPEKPKTQDPLMPAKAEEQQAIQGEIPADYKPVYGQDGVTIYQNASGQTISQKTAEGVTETTIDGTTHKYSEQAQPDGTTQRSHTVIENGRTQVVNDVVRPDGTIERSTSDTAPSDKSFEELTGGASPDPLPAGGRGRSELTTTRQVTIDPATGQETVVSTGQSVTQTGAVTEAFLPEGVTLDKANSQVTRSQASVTHYGPEGPKTETSGGQVTEVQGRRADGSPVAITDSSLTDAQGNKVETREQTGFTRNELTSRKWSANGREIGAQDGQVSGKKAVDHLNDGASGNFRGWLGADDDNARIDVRTTTSTSADGKKTEQVDVGQLGDKDGRRVSRIDQGDNGGVTWVQQETAHNGQRIATQTTKEGQDNFRAQTLTEKGPGGDVKVTTDVYAGNTLLEQNKLDHHQLRSEDDLNTYIEKLNAGQNATPEEQAAYDRMREQLRAGESVVVDDQSSIRYSHDATPDALGSWDKRSTTLSAGDVMVGRSGERLNANTGVENLHADGWGGIVLNGSIYKETGFVKNPDGQPPVTGSVKYGLSGSPATADGLWRVSDEVTTLEEGFTIGSDGRVTPSGRRDNALLDYYHEIDHVAHPELDKAADSDALSDLVSPGSNGVSGAADVSEALGKGLPALPDALLGSVGLMVGGVQIFHGLNEGDAQKTASGLNQFGGSAFSMLGPWARSAEGRASAAASSASARASPSRARSTWGPAPPWWAPACAPARALPSVWPSPPASPPARSPTTWPTPATPPPSTSRR